MFTRRATLGLFALTPLALTLTPRAALAREPEVFQNPVAINAIDPVAYFTDQKPVAGSSQHIVSWKGADWHFATDENASLFLTDPKKYAPLFGGYCAYAASLGYLAPTVPEAWTIYEDRLYLNANLRAQELWRQDIPGNITKGRANWPAVLG